MEIRMKVVGSDVAIYQVIGNKYLAIAININDPSDAHHFKIDPDVNNDAFIRACAWAFQG